MIIKTRGRNSRSTMRKKIAMLQNAFPAFEARSGQLDMMNLIHNSFETSQDAIIEAGTGIGKSIGYLLPAVYFAKKTSKTCRRFDVYASAAGPTSSKRGS
ncbi:hypothetical protein RCO48_32215 [Peribacillus frigoritolerans]|nr:hypothetical protein [Peribacillus frigoritolerans]